jgi:hypothetical protein
MTTAARETPSRGSSLEAAGVEFVDEDENKGPGVRLSKRTQG